MTTGSSVHALIQYSIKCLLNADMPHDVVLVLTRAVVASWVYLHKNIFFVTQIKKLCISLNDAES